MQESFKLGALAAATLSGAFFSGTAWALQDASAIQRDVMTRIQDARPGETVIVPATYTGPLVIADKHSSTPITVRIESSNVENIVVRSSSNIIVEGGKVIGGPTVAYGVHIDQSRSVTVRGMTVTGAVRGIVLYRAEAIGVFGNNLTGLRTGGVIVGESRQLLIEGNSCSNFSPIPAVYAADGTLIKDGDHPDCIQVWSRPTTAPSADIIIRGNSMTGTMQGIFLGNHVRNGVDDGGFDRVTIEGNYVDVSYPMGISVTSVRVGRIVGNEVRTIDGSRLRNGTGSLVNATISAISSTAVVACDNIVEARPTGYGTNPCSEASTTPQVVPAPVTEPVAPAPEPDVPPPAPEPAPVAPEPVAPLPTPIPEPVTPVPAPEPVAPAPAPEPVAPAPAPEPVAPPAPAPEPETPAPAPQSAPAPAPSPASAPAPAPAPAPEPAPAPAPAPAPEPAPAPAPASEPVPTPQPAPAPQPAPVAAAAPQPETTPQPEPAPQPAPVAAPAPQPETTPQPEPAPQPAPVAAPAPQPEPTPTAPQADPFTPPPLVPLVPTTPAPQAQAPATTTPSNARMNGRGEMDADLANVGGGFGGAAINTSGTSATSAPVASAPVAPAPTPTRKSSKKKKAKAVPVARVTTNTPAPTPSFTATVPSPSAPAAAIAPTTQPVLAVVQAITSPEGLAVTQPSNNRQRVPVRGNMSIK